MRSSISPDVYLPRSEASTERFIRSNCSSFLVSSVVILLPKKWFAGVAHAFMAAPSSADW